MGLRKCARVEWVPTNGLFFIELALYKDPFKGVSLVQNGHQHHFIDNHWLTWKLKRKKGFPQMGLPTHFVEVLQSTKPQIDFGPN